jgi:hypothetical protein
MRSMLRTIQNHLQNRLGVSSSSNGHRFRVSFGFSPSITGHYKQLLRQHLARPPREADQQSERWVTFVDRPEGGSDLADESVQAPG